LESTHFKWSFAARSFASLTFISAQSKGFGLCLGIGVALLAITLMDRQKPPLNGTQLGGLAFGLAWPVLLTLFYFGARHALSPMLADWVCPLQHSSGANRARYRYPHSTASVPRVICGPRS